MALCRRCKRTGLLTRVDDHGVCRSCRLEMVADAEKRARSIEDARRYVEDGARLELRLARCEAIIEHATVLADYGHFGVWHEDLDPGVLKSRYRSRKRELTHAALADIVEGATGRAASATSLRTRRGALERGLEKIESLKSWLDEPKEARPYENEIADRISRLPDPR